jgi:histidine triad (HIT) family protein
MSWPIATSEPIMTAVTRAAGTRRRRGRVAGVSEPTTDCVFCGIVNGTVEASVVAADDTTLAFLDLRQPSWPRGGSVLVVPRAHVEQVDELPAEVAGAVMGTVVRVAGAVRKALAPEGISVWSSNGAAAGQEVPHVHLHVVARFGGDGLLRVYAERPPYPGRADLDELAARITGGLGSN